MDRATKEAQVEELKNLIVGAQAVVLTEYKGMTVEEMFALRREFDKVGVGYRVVKNTLAKLAIAGTPYEFLGEQLEGPVAVAYSAEDPVAPAKVLATFQKTSKHLKVKLGFLDGKRLEAAQVEALSKLPGKDELRSKLLSVLQGTATKLVMILSAVPRDFVGVLTARKQALEEEAGA